MEGLGRKIKKITTSADLLFFLPPSIPTPREQRCGAGRKAKTGWSPIGPNPDRTSTPREDFAPPRRADAAPRASPKRSQGSSRRNPRSAPARARRAAESVDCSPTAFAKVKNPGALLPRCSGSSEFGAFPPRRSQAASPSLARVFQGAAETSELGKAPEMGNGNLLCGGYMLHSCTSEQVTDM